MENVDLLYLASVIKLVSLNVQIGTSVSSGVPGKAHEPFLVSCSCAVLRRVCGRSPGSRGHRLRRHPQQHEQRGLRRFCRLFPQQVGSRALVRNRLGNSPGLCSLLSPFCAASAEFH